ncbi:MAG: hypothetical protein IPP94_13440 [Ignavibacteria bacterium]|nr:hypothetical protein [Ignavibacteria bacterium]
MSEYRSEKDFLQSLKRFNSLSSKKYAWHTGVSEKEHECMFGHAIPAESLYFKKPLDMDGEQKIRVCKTCMEKLVFVTVDSDTHARSVTDLLYKQHNPPIPKLVDMSTH